MAFIQASAPNRQREGGLLSADNVLPERHIIIELLRKAAPLLKLKPPALATLEAMLSCLAPKRNHHMVFASNNTLTHRRSGISDRTIRRHVIQLADAGLLTRHDSPNRKRFSRHNPVEGKSMRFGFDLSPLFDQLHTIARMAATAEQEQEQIQYLRMKIRSAANATLAENPYDSAALNLLKLLRRKLDLAQLEALIATLSNLPKEHTQDSEVLSADTNEMTGTNSQNVRHHHRSIKDNIDKNAQNASPDTETISITELTEACPEAMQYALGKIATVQDVVTHGRSLAPMIGIDSANYQSAEAQIGPLKTAVTIWAMLQLQGTIHQAGAYFRAITSGTKSQGFNPFKLVQKLLRQQAQNSRMLNNCPRTI